jgi:hypothetical protein
MPAPSNLPAALFRHAASGPEEPWLFRAEGWDWRWHSWGEIARRVEAQAEILASQAAGPRVAFAYEPCPEAIVFDLAIQAAGLVSEPSPPQPSSPGPPPTLPGRGGSQEIQFLTRSPSPRQGWVEGWERGPGGEGSGGAVVLRNGETVELTAADLIAMAEGVQKLVEPAGEHEIVVLGGPLEDPDERAMLSWATLAGAAVVLEPNPALRVATAAWARPTVFHGTAEEIVALRAWVKKEKGGLFRRRPRLPFRRLRTVLARGDSVLGAEEDAYWTERGVQVKRLSMSGEPRELRPED